MKRFIKISSTCLIIILALFTSAYAQKADEQTEALLSVNKSELVEVIPGSYSKALRNPLKGLDKENVRLKEIVADLTIDN